MRRRAFLIAALLVGAAHLLILLLLHLPVLLSNFIQILPPLLAILLCLAEARRAPSKYFARLWRQLSFAFLTWLVAQIIFFFYVLAGHDPPYPSIADFFWMLFAFPVFLVISNTQETAHDWVAWLDIGQACISVSVLYILMFSRPALIGVNMTYDVQSAALFVVSALRYLIAAPGREKIFFRNLFIYIGVYALCSAIGVSAPSHGFPTGSLSDLAWSVPLLVFCLFTSQLDRDPLASLPAAGALRTHLHGIAALALALLSVGAGGFLAMHRPVLGMLALAVSFMLFAARTSLRESQLHAAHARLEDASLHDALTGLANRTLLLRELSRCLAAAPATPDRTFAVLFVDLDRFKTINDSLGHAYGDRLLCQAARVIRASIRPADTLARLGGDEFVVLLENVEHQGFARDTAQNVIAALQMPLTLEGRVTYLNASIGVVLGTQAASGDEILRNADCAMYEAKAMGKGRARIYAPSMLSRAKEELLVETELREALDQGHIAVWYQPIYSVSADRIYGFEALARWQHPLRGLVAPSEFIPIAEDTGLIIELGRQVLRKACLQVRNWNSLHQSSFSISVNISASQFSDPNLLEDILDTVRSTRFDLRLLKLEITESVLIGGLQRVKQVLESARAAGIEIYLDDFGTGYSSLSYLLDFPFDTVKIDRSFVRRLERDERRTEVVRMIIQLALNLKKRVIAEGVETAAELERLTFLGCDLIQGYLMSRPLPCDAMTRLLADSTHSLLPDHKQLSKPILIAASPSSPPAVREKEVLKAL